MPEDIFIVRLRRQHTRLIRLRDQAETRVFTIRDRLSAPCHADVGGQVSAIQRAIESIELAIRDYEICHI